MSVREFHIRRKQLLKTELMVSLRRLPLKFKQRNQVISVLEIHATPWPLTILLLLIRIRLFLQTSPTKLAIHLQIATVNMLKDKENLPATKDTCALSLIKMDPKKVFAFQEVMIVSQVAIATKVDPKMSQTSADATLVIAFLSTVLSPRIVRTKTCSVLDQTTLHPAKGAVIHRKDPASAFSLGTITETSYIMSMGTT